MKNLICLFGIYFLFLFTPLSAQCPTTDIVIKSQTELNQLFNNYPNCHKITKSITFANTGTSSFTNLNAMLKIDSILGDLVLTVKNNPTLDGFSNIKYIGGTLNIYSNSHLTNVPSFDSLKVVSKNLIIASNPKLSSIRGFEKLKKAKQVMISSNELVDTVDAFHSIDSLFGNFEQFDLKKIEILNVFNALKYCGGTIKMNFILSPEIKSLPSFNQLRYIKSDFSIFECPMSTYSGLELLESAESIFINLPNATMLDLAPNAKYIGVIGLHSCPKLETLSGFDNLTSVKTINIDLPVLTQLTSFDKLEIASTSITLRLLGIQNLSAFSNLKEAGSFNIYLDKATSFQLAPQLERVNGSMELLGSYVTSCNNFNKLIEVKGELKINLSSITVFPNFNELQYVMSLIVEGTKCKSINGFHKLKRVSQNFNFSFHSELDSIIGFQELKYIGNQLTVRGNTKLTYLTEFPSLDTLGTLYFFDNRNLQSIKGFHNLQYLYNETFYALYISNCSALTSVSGFEKMTYCGEININSIGSMNHISGFDQLQYINGNVILDLKCENLPDFSNLEIIKGNLYIENNTLKKFPTFQKLKSVLGNFTIWDADKIPELSPFDSLRNITGIVSIAGALLITNLNGLSRVYPYDVSLLEIKYNPKLSICNNNFVCGYLALGKPSQINNNAPGCNQPSEIDCTGGLIKGLAFYDRNLDGIRNNGEPGLANVKVDVNNLDPLLISNETGLMSLYCAVGNIYTITSLHNPKFKPTTDTAFIYQYDINDENDTLFYFGFIYEDNAREGKITITSDRTRCNTQSKIYINILNESGYDQDGEVKLYYNDLNALSNFDPAPEFIDPLKGFAVWKFYNFQPPSYQKITASLQVPSEDSTGDTLAFQTSYYVKNNDGSYQLLDSSLYTSEVRCAFDPNDISVSPIGALYRINPDQTFNLTYTIRFQNIGNDTAIDVSLFNLISTDLDRNSFQFIASSHPCNLQLYGDVLEADFPSIFLPSKNQNEALSQGYITYSIQTKEGLPDSTVIGNYAEIYFDQNAPILTNTVTNTLVDLLVATKEEEATLPLVWFPNPVYDQLCLQLEELPKEVNLEIFNQLGQRIYQSTGLCHLLHHLPSGTMLARVKTSTQSQSFVFIKH